MPKAFIAALATSMTFVIAAGASADGARSPQAAPTFMTPSTISPACRSTATAGAACDVIRHFFRAINSKAFGMACSLLGQRLRADTHGLPCTDFLRLGVPEAVPWGILGARRSGSGVSILVTVGQSELGEWRMRGHRAFVGLEEGELRILRTRLVA